MRPENLSAEPEQTTAAIQEAERTGSIRVPMRWHRKKDGTVFPVEYTACPFIWKDRKVLSVFVRDITERKRAEAELADRLRFETLLADLSARFVNVPAEQLDDAIERALRRVCECLGLEEFSLWQASREDADSVVPTHLYRALPGPPLPERMDAREYFPWCYRQIVDLNAKVIAVSSLEELPAEAARDREAWRQLGSKSVLVIGLYVGGGTHVGALSFNTTAAERTWSEEIVNRLQLVAGIFSNALARQRSDRALRESEGRYRTLFENAPVGIYRTTPEGQTLAANPAFLRLLGYSSFEELAASDLNIECSDHGYPRKRFQELMERHREVTGLEGAWRRRDGSIVHVRENARVFRDDSGRVLYYEGTVEDITPQKEAQHRQDLTVRVLDILNRAGSLSGMIGEILRVVREHAGFDAVGMRLREGEDFPYFVQEGFSAEFVKRENLLCSRTADGALCRDEHGQPILEGTCGMVMRGRTDPSNPLFTPGGSFWTDGFSRLLQLPTEQDPRRYPRNRCIFEGYESVALIPIRVGQEIAGLLQLNDRRPDRFTADTIRFFEGIGASIGLGLARQREEEALRQSEQFNREVIASAREGVIVYDRELRYQVWNRFMEELSGVPASQVLGKQGFDLFPHLRECEVEVLLQRALKGEVVQSPDMPFRVPLTGKSGWVSSVLSPHFGPNAEIIGVISIVRDITERKRAEEALEQAANRFELVTLATQDAVFDWDLVSREIWRNENYRRLFGAPERSLDSDNFWVDRLHSEDRERVVTAQDAALGSEDKLFLAEYRLRRPEGSYADILQRSHIVRDAKGQVVRMIGALTDVSERKRAEEALRESEARFRSLFENATVGIYRTTPEGRILMANPTMVRMLRYDSFQALASVNVESQGYAPGYSRNAFREQVEREGEVKGFESAWKRGDGTVVFVRESARAVRAPDGQVLHYDGIVEDVTERKRAEEALRESEKLYRLLAENVTDVIWTTDLDLRYMYISPSVMRLRTVTVEEALAEKTEETLTPSSLKVAKRTFAEELSKESNPQEDPSRSRTLELEQIRKDGSTVWTEVRATFLRDSEGRPVGILGVTRDISARRRAEEALTASEQRYRELFENAMDIVFTYDLQGNFTSLNKVAEQSSGYTCAELACMNVLQILAPEYVEEGRRALEDLAAGREPGIGEWEIVTKDGHRVWLEASLRLVRRNGELAEVQGIARDITERKRAEAQLRDYLAQLHALAARLQSVREEERARLAREIHDELGQDLTAIKIELTSIFRKLGESTKPFSGATESILKLVEQTIRSVRRIATELRPGILDDLGLTAAIEWATEEFQARTGIKCHLELREEHIVLHRERTTAIFRIFQETLTNVARHSRATELQVRLFRQNANTILEVRDNGVGIQPQHLTSPASLGILGMRERALVLGGQFEIASRPGEGTKVTVQIPDLSSNVVA
jgi:PAS domain S-box-containing protein